MKLLKPTLISCHMRGDAGTGRGSLQRGQALSPLPRGSLQCCQALSPLQVACIRASSRPRVLQHEFSSQKAFPFLASRFSLGPLYFICLFSYFTSWPHFPSLLSFQSVPPIPLFFTPPIYSSCVSV